MGLLENTKNVVKTNRKGYLNLIVWGEIYALHAENSKHEVLVKPSSQDVNHVAERVGDTVWFSADATITGNETKKGTLLFLIGDIQAMVANGQIVIREFS